MRNKLKKYFKHPSKTKLHIENKFISYIFQELLKHILLDTAHIHELSSLLYMYSYSYKCLYIHIFIITDAILYKLLSDEMARIVLCI